LLPFYKRIAKQIHNFVVAAIDHDGSPRAPILQAHSMHPSDPSSNPAAPVNLPPLDIHGSIFPAMVFDFCFHSTSIAKQIHNFVVATIDHDGSPCAPILQAHSMHPSNPSSNPAATVNLPPPNIPGSIFPEMACDFASIGESICFYKLI
jgi:hypothetical protein